MSAQQQYGAASTFAKRYAFLNAFGISTGDEDNDAVHTEASTRPTTSFRTPPALIPNQPKYARTPIDQQALTDGYKTTIVRLLTERGEPTGTREECEFGVNLLTGLALEEKNYAKIIQILSEPQKKENPGPTVKNPAERFPLTQLFCADCGAELAKVVYDWAITHYGKPLCRDGLDGRQGCQSLPDNKRLFKK